MLSLQKNSFKVNKLDNSLSLFEFQQRFSSDNQTVFFI